MTTDENTLFLTINEIQTAIALPKCQQCGCMQGALKKAAEFLPTVGPETNELVQVVGQSLTKMRQVQYECLGCDYCYVGVIENNLGSIYPGFAAIGELSCDFKVREEVWFPVAGEYYVVDKSAAVAVTTLSSVELATELAQMKPTRLSVVGKTETENIGIDKIIKNVISSSSIRFLVVAGTESKGHLTGATLLALAKNGIDQNGRVIGAAGKKPVLRNVTFADVQTFCQQVQVVDMVGCEDIAQITAKIEELGSQPVETCECSACGPQLLQPLIQIAQFPISNTKVIVTEPPVEAVKLDKTGYFVVMPLLDSKLIQVEYYLYDNSLVRVYEGATARALYLKLVEDGCVSELNHAAYLGKELAKAELSLQMGFKYIQDGA
jgi:tetrahydromethanopterin S-methyltransferase subunit A